MQSQKFRSHLSTGCLIVCKQLAKGSQLPAAELMPSRSGLPGKYNSVLISGDALNCEFASCDWGAVLLATLLLTPAYPPLPRNQDDKGSAGHESSSYLMQA